MSLELNYYFIGSLICWVFSGFMLFFLLTIKKKSKATWELAMTCLGLFLFHSGYLLGFATTSPLFVYHRWLVIVGVPIFCAHFTAFLFFFPEIIYPRLARTLQILTYLSGVVVLSTFVWESLHHDVVYFLSNHYWEFATVGFYKWYSNYVMILFFMEYGIGIWRGFRERKADRYTIWTIVLAFMTISLVPGILNKLSREAIVSRSFYQSTMDICLVLGLFLIAVVYINRTKDKSSIMGRIVGITLALFCLVFQMVAYFTLMEREKTFDEIAFRDLESSIYSGRRFNQLLYLTEFDPASNTYKMVFEAEDQALPDFHSVDAEFENTYIRSQIENLKTSSEDKLRIEVASILEKAPESFLPYRYLLEELLKNSSDEKELLQKVDLLSQDITILRNKLREASPAKVEETISKLFVAGNSPMGRFSAGILELNQKIQSEPAERKSRLIDILSPFAAPGYRFYRGQLVLPKDGKKPDYFVSFQLPDPDKQVVYEAGFSYHYYREFIHSPSLIIAILFVTTSLVIWFGLPLFLLGVLMRPLNSVVNGLKEVHSGNLNTSIPVKVQDEIGYLAMSFNRMVRSIKGQKLRLQKHAEELEDKVNERTKELASTLEEVQHLKQQQDGDYFLTSLLIRALKKNRATQELVKVDFLIEQKKKFHFREYEEEIGGDLNISNHIELRGRSYTVFLNADAMGKSLQGASGALVLGSVFEAIIDRTQATSSGANQSPERWIKNSFLELHKVFESFDGSMLVSAVMGLVDDKTGLIYYVNAEHPWTVLYRDGKASFIEEELLFRKLGTPGLNGKLFVKTFQMETGDVMIAGSDGRDDLLLAEATGSENRIINEDESLFLKAVELGEGNLQKIRDVLSEEGSLTDDLSLLRISFKEGIPSEEIFSELPEEKTQILNDISARIQSKDFENTVRLLDDPRLRELSHPQAVRKLVRWSMDLEQFSNALIYAEKYIDLNPADTDMLYIASFCARKCNEIHKAQEYGERVRLRNPSNVRNLKNLAAIYVRLKNWKRAQEIIEEVVALGDEGNSTQKLIDIVEKNSSKS